MTGPDRVRLGAYGRPCTVTPEPWRRFVGRLRRVSVVRIRSGEPHGIDDADEVIAAFGRRYTSPE